MSDCIFCRMLNGELPASFVYRDDRCAAFMDIQPVNVGHLLVIPVRHGAYLADIDADAAADLMRVGHSAAAALRASGLPCEGVNFFLADGEVAMQEVFHVHLHVFPRFRKAGKMVDLVNTLLRQHQAGRRVTATILKLAPNSRNDGDDRRQLVSTIQSFIAMYRPHAAREDTDLFPKLQELVSAHEYDAMGEQLEKEEHRLFGEDGFEKMADRVAQLERAIGIYNLNQFTPA